MRPNLTILLAAPRGFCAGVDRAIQVVERALAKFSPPVYVRHEIVHNRHVVEDLRAKGAVFVDDLSEVPDGAPVIFSAHGVAKAVVQEAANRQLLYVDATCPLVSKVHRQAERFYNEGYHLLLIGHAGHPEVIGTMGQVPAGAVSLIETVADVATFVPPPQPLAYTTQTTLSLDETASIIAALKKRFPNIAAPIKEDICYATTNRQHAVQQLAPRCDGLLVIGSETSSNSKRLVESAVHYGCPQAWLIDDAAAIPWDALQHCKTVGLTAGASAPEVLVQQVLSAFCERFTLTVEEITTRTEQVVFNLPKIVA